MPDLQIPRLSRPRCTRYLAAWPCLREALMCALLVAGAPLYACSAVLPPHPRHGNSSSPLAALPLTAVVVHYAGGGGFVGQRPQLLLQLAAQAAMTTLSGVSGADGRKVAANDPLRRTAGQGAEECLAGASLAGAPQPYTASSKKPCNTIH